ncbi:hypothetical protein, unlikely [Trypanosoma congolense IL3000]|uniref:Uncharacterized protein n=1 Tax=Trypanosoma congolense (strain IL3000) TaxID=1068625 RepID=F9W687_TRYCI|nr:hypothetical protein, unlikely [Trypanosoma congolense IL3000]
MEIIDRPLSEIIKEQKIGESLRRNRRGGKGSQQGGRGNRSIGGLRRGDDRRPLSSERRRFRQRRPDGPFRSSRFSYSSRRRFTGRRGAVDYGDSRWSRSVKSISSMRESRLTGAERNERIRSARRREALSRARSRFYD